MDRITIFLLLIRREGLIDVSSKRVILMYILEVSGHRMARKQ